MISLQRRNPIVLGQHQSPGGTRSPHLAMGAGSVTSGGSQLRGSNMGRGSAGTPQKVCSDSPDCPDFVLMIIFMFIFM